VQVFDASRAVHSPLAHPGRSPSDRPDALALSTDIANDNATHPISAAPNRAASASTIAVHVVLGLTAIASAYAVVDVPAYAITTIAGAIVYISWFGRSVAGLVVACGVGLFEILSRLERPGISALGVVCAIVYVLLAWTVSAIEKATRPSLT
jgi:hypothetical protein